MAKVIAPFKIEGTLGGINFYLDEAGNNYAREKAKSGITTKQFLTDPVFERQRSHRWEWKQTIEKANVFRRLASHFFANAKEVSSAGRSNKLIFEILQEDTVNPHGQRQVAEGLNTPDGKELLLYFEANRTRPLQKVLKSAWGWDAEKLQVNLPKCCIAEDLDWPEDATHVHFAAAVASWDYVNNTFETIYSEDVIVAKTNDVKDISLSLTRPEHMGLKLVFFFVGFAKQERKKYALLHRVYNTATVIACMGS